MNSEHLDALFSDMKICITRRIICIGTLGKPKNGIILPLDDEIWVAILVHNCVYVSLQEFDGYCLA